MGGAVVLGLQTPPETVTSNAAKWFGVISGHIPNWPHQIDTWLTVPAVLLMLTPLWTWLWRRKTKPGPSLPAQTSLPRATDEMAYWSNVDDMKVWQAAYLWLGLLPAKDYPAEAPPLVKAQLHRMNRAIGNKQLAVMSVAKNSALHPLLQVMDTFVNSTEYATASRAALLAYANARGEQPAFLYPS